MNNFIKRLLGIDAPTFNSEQWAGPLELHVVDREASSVYRPELDEPELEIIEMEPLIIGGWED